MSTSNNTQEPTVWVCLVCGYVHHGPEPPENCPVCGATRENFEPHSAKTPEPAQPAPQQWRCMICDYHHFGPRPPERCPVCSASADEFEPVEEKAPAAAASSRKCRAVILGGGIAGVSAAENLRQSAPDAHIVLISKEPEVPYYRLNLTRFLAGEIVENDLPIHPEEWYQQQEIDLRRGVEATAINPAEHVVLFRDGGREPFEKLVVTCGSHPFVPPIAGASKEGVTVFRTAKDAQFLLDSAKAGAKCVVVGGGILGLETAGGLARHGLDVTILEGAEWLLPRQLDAQGGETLRRFVAERGVAVRYQAKTAEIAGDDRARGILFADGATLPADLVVIAAGVRCNSYLARMAGLHVNQGIVVDANLRTSHPDVYAAGDVAEHQGTLYGLWEPARYQGAIAGMNVAGVPTEFGGLPRANTLKVLGVDMFSVGTIMPVDGSYDVIAAEIDGCYYRFMFHDGALVGAILVGNTHLTPAVTNAIKSHADCSALLQTRPNAAQVMEHFS